MEQTPVSLSRRQRPMFLVRRSVASPGRGSGGFLWKERTDNAALRQRLHDSAQIKDDTRIVGDQHGEIALLFDGVALALGMRRSGAKQGGTATYTHDRTLTRLRRGTCRNIPRPVEFVRDNEADTQLLASDIKPNKSITYRH